MTVLVVGGAGYIGAHVVRLLAAQGTDVVVVDDLSTGRLSRVPDVPFRVIDICSTDAVEELSAVLREFAVDSVVHLAAKKQVRESVEDPSYYYRQNVGGLLNLLDAMRFTRTRRLVFSSSAAVYGDPPAAAGGGVVETVPAVPLSPYGQTKLVGEWLCADAERAWDLRWCALRYFNVVGAGADDLADHAATNLLPLVFDAIERGEPPELYGDDYSTPDATCVRDYIHVADLADAHVAAIAWLAERAPDSPSVFNVGTGVGTSVREVFTEAARVTGTPVVPRVVERRAGDPESVVADVSLIAAHLGWRSTRTFSDAVASAWRARESALGRAT